MPLIGESASSPGAYSFGGGDTYSASWSLDFPPTAAFIKLALGSYYESDDISAVQIGLLNIRWRDPRGVDQTITFPDIGALERVLVQFNETMTHVTFGMNVKEASATLVWTLGIWG